MKYRYLLIFALIISMFLKLGTMPFIFEEPRRTEVAMEMILNNNYVVPTINDIYYYNKPPVHNWMLAATFQLFNTHSEFAARSTTVISFLLLGLLVFIVTRKLVSEETAWLAMIFTLTTGDIFYRFSLLAEIDVFYSLIVFLQGISIIYFWKRKNLWLLFIFSYIFCALGFLTKGPTSLAFQVFSILGWAIGFGQFKKIFSIQHISGILVFALVIAAYFLSYSAYNDPLLFISKLLAESSEKTISTGIQLDYLLKWINFPLMFLQVILPWGILLLLINKSYLSYLKNDEVLKFCLIFIVANIWIYWLSPGTRPRYLYPFVPFVMIILGNLAEKRFYQSALGKIIQRLFLLLMTVVGLGILISPFFTLPDQIQSPWILALSGGGVMIVLVILYHRYAKHRLWIFVSFLITVRILFDFTIIPVRNADILETMDFKKITAAILGKADGERVWLYSPKKTELLRPAFFGVRLPEKENHIIEWPPFQLSYYLASESGQVLSWDEGERGKLYLADERFIHDKEIEILEKYSIKGKNKTFVLFRFLSNR